MSRSAPAQSLPLWGLIEQAARRWHDQPMLVSRQGDRATFGEYRDYRSDSAQPGQECG